MKQVTDYSVGFAGSPAGEPIDRDYEDDFPCCGHCGSELEWVECYLCHGEGEFDMYDQLPLEYEPGDIEYCDICKGEGGYLECPNLPHGEAIA